MEETSDFKFGHLVDDEDLPYRYPNVWATETTTGPDRLVIAPEGAQVALMLDLTEVLPEPFAVLYVHVVPRSGSEAGRYQSSIIDRATLRSFMEEFRSLFEGDGRHHIWVFSLREDYRAFATLVYDRHDVIYAYGPLDEFRAVLAEQGLTPVDAVRYPTPHSHHYNASLDGEVERLLSYWEWQATPLQSGDES